MRKEVRKFLFVGAMEDKKAFFRQAQEEGVVQFIDPKPTSREERPAEIQTLYHAIRVLRGLEPAPQEELRNLREADKIATEVCHLSDQMLALEEEERVLRQEIARVHIFGHFSTEDIRFLEGRGQVVQFFFSRSLHDLPEEPYLIPIGSDHSLHYFVSIAPERQTIEGLTEMKIERPLNELEARLEDVVRERRVADLKLKTFAKRKEFLEKGLLDHLNRHNLLTAQERVHVELGEQVFAVEGWVPSHKLEALERMAEEGAIHVEEILIEEKDHVPTFLENDKLARVGEDLVHIYDTPSTHDRDPSRWVLWFFAFFFAIIIADAGYGLILLGTGLFLRMKFGKKKGLAKRFVTLCLILATSAILWGVLTNAFFGIQLSPENPMRKVSLSNWLVREKVAYVLDNPQSSTYKEWVQKYPSLAQDKTVDGWLNGAIKMREGTKIYDLLNQFSDNIMIELAVMIGVIHLILSFLRVIDRNWAGAGWILFLVGGYLFFPSVLNATSIIHFVFGVPEQAGAIVGLEILFVGIGAAIVLALIQNRKGGMFEIANVIQVFADTLSYLRLYALGLAGAMMSATFNDIGSSAGYFFGALIILVGHSVNITLAIIGGVIHGLRLNFLEWYRHCFDGGGRMLRPLKLLIK